MNDFPFEIVDAHHHLWDLKALHYPWLMARGVPRFFGDPTPIQQDYLVEHFLDDAAQIPLAASVHIQVGVNEEQALAETRWLQSVADHTPSRSEHQGFPGAIIGYADLTSPTLASDLAAHAESANFRGVRQIVGRSAKEDAQSGTASLLHNPSWRKGLGQLAEAQLCFDLQLIPEQLPALVTLLRDLPDLKVALCHCGSPWDRSEQGMELWRTGMRELSQLPNVYCKLSGLGMYDHHWSVESIRPIVLETIDLFGPARCMFGSNFPVDKLYSSYNAIWWAFSQITQGFSAAERQRLFAETAQEYYRIK